jgi:hypothetical protein
MIDPKSLPETKGEVTKFLFNFHNDANGFLLDGEHQVYFPPHMSQRLLKKVKVGELVTIHGLKRRGSDVLVAISITKANGAEIIDTGSDGAH